MKDLISVIVPIYNVEAYLPRCVESIINQTYENIEIILVDDGSTDSCGDICDSYSEKDNRIIVIHKQNGGLSDARNAGIEILKGKYVTFIDSDDWVELNYIERLYQMILDNDADISACDFYIIDNDDHIYNSPAIDGSISVWDREKAIAMLLMRNKMGTSAWGKLFNSNFFSENGLRFPVGRLYEDIPVIFKAVLKVDKIVFENYALYNYFIRSQSISNKSFSPQKMHAVEHVESIVPLVLQQFPHFDKLCSMALFFVNFNTYLSMDGEKEYEKYEKKVIKAIKKYRSAVVFSKYSTRKWRIKALSTYLGLYISKKIFTKRYIKGNKI